MFKKSDYYQQFANPDYGQGVFRRRIRLTATAGQVLAELEDCAHGFRSTVLHADALVTGVYGEVVRAPYTTCAGAVEPIKKLVGQSIHTPAAEINMAVNARSNCTHLYDLSVLAIGFCSAGEAVRQIDIEVPDEDEDPVWVRVHINGEEVLAWRLQGWQLSEPKALAGKPMHQGFAAWVNEELQGLEQLAAFALQKAYLVSHARRLDMDALAGTPATDNEMMMGVCHTFSSPSVEQAVRLPKTMRDFTLNEEQLLQFK